MKKMKNKYYAGQISIKRQILTNTYQQIPCVEVSLSSSRGWWWSSYFSNRGSNIFQGHWLRFLSWNIGIFLRSLWSIC